MQLTEKEEPVLKHVLSVRGDRKLMQFLIGFTTIDGISYRQCSTNIRVHDVAVRGALTAVRHTRKTRHKVYKNSIVIDGTNKVRIKIKRPAARRGYMRRLRELKTNKNWMMIVVRQKHAIDSRERASTNIKRASDSNVVDGAQMRTVTGRVLAQQSSTFYTNTHALQYFKRSPSHATSCSILFGSCLQSPSTSSVSLMSCTIPLRRVVN